MALTGVDVAFHINHNAARWERSSIPPVPNFEFMTRRAET